MSGSNRTFVSVPPSRRLSFRTRSPRRRTRCEEIVAGGSGLRTELEQGTSTVDRGLRDGRTRTNNHRRSSPPEGFPTVLAETAVATVPSEPTETGLVFGIGNRCRRVAIEPLAIRSASMPRDGERLESGARASRFEIATPYALESAAEISRQKTARVQPSANRIRRHLGSEGDSNRSDDSRGRGDGAIGSLPNHRGGRESLSASEERNAKNSYRGTAGGSIETRLTRL
jgi:hypothetical protein